MLHSYRVYIYDKSLHRCSQAFLFQRAHKKPVKAKHKLIPKHLLMWNDNFHIWNELLQSRWDWLWLPAVWFAVTLRHPFVLWRACVCVWRLPHRDKLTTPTLPWSPSTQHWSRNSFDAQQISGAGWGRRTRKKAEGRDGYNDIEQLHWRQERRRG